MLRGKPAPVSLSVVLHRSDERIFLSCRRWEVGAHDAHSVLPDLLYSIWGKCNVIMWAS